MIVKDGGNPTRVARLSPSQSAATGGREHGMDGLRAAALLLGLVLHAGMSYMKPPALSWPVVDASRSGAFSAIVFTIHSFRMPVFFLIAGYFGRMLVRKRGWGGFAANRFRRVAIPFLLSCAVLVPTLQFAWITGYRNPTARQLEMLQRISGREEPFRQDIGEFFLRGRFLRPSAFRLFHLWFLFYLLIYYGAAMLAGGAGRTFSLGDRLGRTLMRAARSPAKPLLLALPTFVLFLSVWSPSGPVEPMSGGPNWRMLLYYGYFFLAGWLVHGQPGALRILGARWKILLSVALVALLPATFAMSDRLKAARGQEVLWERLLFQSGYALLVWLMVLGLIGLFMEWFSTERRAMRYISDASYWVYLVHLTPIVLLQYAVRGLSWPAFAKFGAVLGGTVALAFVSYAVFVRHTFIGTMLNGPQKRGRDLPNLGEDVVGLRHETIRKPRPMS